MIINDPEIEEDDEDEQDNNDDVDDFFLYSDFPPLETPVGELNRYTQP